MKTDKATPIKFTVSNVYDVEDGVYEIFGKAYQSPKGLMYPCKREGSTTMIGLATSFVDHLTRINEATK